MNKLFRLFGKKSKPETALDAAIRVAHRGSRDEFELRGLSILVEFEHFTTEQLHDGRRIRVQILDELIGRHRMVARLDQTARMYQSKSTLLTTL